ncbi:hypothetical protein BD410DRAFT_837117 [Rickenella mellea]|uniref:Galactose oxidase n=1 Tax=Rickenella mellea TaxID=50990 RepID=A0A4Y7QE63_9AGAM|nr:hypothetical protein BD410DRAFT_837117 [Rickenella mellea]
MTPVLWLHIPVYLLVLLQGSFAQFTSLPRWGQATVLVHEILFVHGGKTDQFNAYSYTSAPTNNDLFLLDLSVVFQAASPPWQYVGGSANSSAEQGPMLAWHTLSAYNNTQVLVFGGDGGPNSTVVLPEEPDSASILDVYDQVEPRWITEPQSWANEPDRRIHHAAASIGGDIWLVGGEKNDGSGLAFSDHYLFNPSPPNFTLLPTGGPPDLYGHATVVLGNGTILVLGGYSASEAQLMPFTTIWALDTTASTLSWYLLSVAISSAPSPRRAFASAVVQGNKVVIHGGSDATLQTTYSDGWVLDASASPMTWTNIADMSQLGARRDHFAVAMGTQVIFGFGYGSNSPATAALQIFDMDSNSFVPSYNPPTTPAQTTLPPASGTYASGQTPTNAPGQSGTSIPGHASGGTNDGSPTIGPVHPTSVNGNDPSPDGLSKKGVTAITVGTIFGFLAVIVAASATYAYHRRHRQDAPGRFRRLLGGEDTDASSPDSEVGAGFGPRPREKVLMAGNGRYSDNETPGWARFGVGRARSSAQRDRFDILADEDEREFEARSQLMRQGSGSSRSWYSGHSHQRTGSGRRPVFGDVFQGSLTSLRSVGAMIASNIGTSGSRRVASSPNWWEKDDLRLDPFADEEALLQSEAGHPSDMPLAPVGGAAVALASRLRGGHTDSGLSGAPYVDPFRDQEAEVVYDVGDDGDDEHSSGKALSGPYEKATQNSHNSSHSTIARSLSSLPPLTTVSSRGSSSEPGTSSTHEPPGSVFSSSVHDSSGSSHDATGALSRASSSRPRTTSIVGAASVPTQPIRRSDSWWRRFKRTSFRETSPDAAQRPNFDFRDPNPAPRLTAIREGSGHSNSPDSPESRAAAGKGPSPKDPRTRVGELYASGGHDRSLSSLQTSKTMDSETIERYGRGMDVVQRERDSTMSSHHSTPSTASVGVDEHPPWTGRPLSVVVGSDASLSHSEDTERPDVPFVESPVDSEMPESAENHSSYTAGSATATHHSGDPPLRAAKRKSTGGSVAARIAEFERRNSQDTLALVSPVSPTRHSPPLDAREGPHKKRKSAVAVNYGLVPKPELFVANPDDRSRQASSS